MSIQPQEISLDLSPQSRFEIIDIRQKISDLINGDINKYRKATYCSFHTTAGYLEQSICSRLRHEKENIKSYIKAFQHLFPINANYRHDVMELRQELTAEEKQVEPKNADSHLTFIGSGLKNCVNYLNKPYTPVYFIDLDGVSENVSRKRHTNAMYYNAEEVVFQHKVRIPVSKHPIDSINLRDPKLGYLDKLSDILQKYEIEKGRIDIVLDPAESNVGVTVNEYETLLMTHDLVEVFKNPLKFMGEKGRYILYHPEKIASRTREYAKYDFVQIFNELMDAFHISQSVVEKIFAKMMAFPAERLLRVKRGISFLISNTGNSQVSEIVQGRYQSPIMIQWKRTPKLFRNMILTVTRYK